MYKKYRILIGLTLILGFGGTTPESCFAQAPGMIWPITPAGPPGPAASSFGAAKAASGYSILNDIRESWVPEQVTFYVEVTKDTPCNVDIGNVSAGGLEGQTNVAATEKDTFWAIENHEFDWNTMTWSMTSQTWMRQLNKEVGTGGFNTYRDAKMYTGSAAGGEHLSGHTRFVWWDFDGDNFLDTSEDFTFMPDQTGNWKKNGTASYRAATAAAGIQEEASVGKTFEQGVATHVHRTDSYSDATDAETRDDTETYNLAGVLTSSDYRTTTFERLGPVDSYTQTIRRENRQPGSSVFNGTRENNVLRVIPNGNAPIPIQNVVNYRIYEYDEATLTSTDSYAYSRTTNLDLQGRPTLLLGSLTANGNPATTVSATWSLQANGNWELDAPWTPATYNAAVLFAITQEESIPNGQPEYIPTEMEMMDPAL